MILGVDPGLDGALALYNDAAGSFEVLDMPTYQIGKKRHLDALGLARWIDANSEHINEVWLEYVAASSQMGVTSAFRFGEGYGILQGVFAANFLKVVSVTPPVWKRSMKVTGDKDECRAAAAKMFPRQSGLFARKKDDGRAEAVLIAVHAVRQNQRPMEVLI